MARLSVIIPSREERFLNRTLQDVFEKARGEVEAVVHLDGYWPSDWKTITDKYPNLHTVHSGSPVGMRGGINKAVGSAKSRGAKYVMKLDAHCMLDEGFDLKIIEHLEPNWVMVPRRKRLDADKWTLTDTHKIDIDYHYLSFPDDPKDFGGKGLNGKAWDERSRERRDKPEYDIDDEMASQGSAWAMFTDYFYELELMDEASYGPFWNEAQEIFNKCWLSGGRCVVNKKTWYAHLHKGKTHGRGYKLPEAWLKQGATFTKNWIWNDAWPKQTKPFKWLIEHFWPVPSWPENWEEVLYAERKPRELGGHFVAGANNIYKHDALPWVGEPSQKPKSVLSGVGLLILSARYGILNAPMPFADHSIDVTDRVQSLVKNSSLDIVVNNSTLAPGQNPYRGKKKVLLLTYSIDDGEQVTVEREEKDWLIIGPVATETNQHVHEFKQIEGQSALECACGAVPQYEDGNKSRPVPVADMTGNLKEILRVHREGIKQGPLVPKAIPLTNPPRTAAALNDYLIRKFQISPQRLRGPMPIELRDFHRNDLAQLFAELGFNSGAEVGVAEGKFSEVILKANPDCHLLLVDPWHAYSDNPQNKSHEKHEFAYSEVVRKTMNYPHVELRQAYSMDAVDGVLYDSLDFVYVDACHLFDYAVMDVIEWSKRVRSGGIVSGDDYYQLDQKRWIGGGVVEAVQAYTNAHRIPIWFLCNAHRSIDYFWVKP